MSKSIVLYHRKQPAIIHTSNEGETWVNEVVSHNKQNVSKIVSKLLNKPIKTIKVSIEGLKGTAIYNDGCRSFEFSLGFINKV